MAIPRARLAQWSIAGTLRRSAWAVEVLLGAAILVAAISAYAIAGVFHQRLTALDTAVSGLYQARSGMQEERSALMSYLETGNTAELAAYHQARAEVSTADAKVLSSDLGGHDILAKLVAVRAAEQAWMTGWVLPVVSLAPSGAGVASGTGAGSGAGSGTGAGAGNGTGVGAGSGAGAGAESRLIAQGNQLFYAYLGASQQATDDLSTKERATAGDEWRTAVVGFGASSVLVVIAGFLVADHRRLAARGLQRAVGPLTRTARQIEAGEGSEVEDLDLPAELEDLGRVVIGMARELDALRQAIDLAEDQAGLRAQKLREVLELTRSIAGNLSLRPVMDSVVAAVQRLSGARRAILWLSDDQGLRMAADTAGPTLAASPEPPPEAVVQAATYGRTSRSGSGVPISELGVPPSGLEVPTLEGVQGETAGETGSEAVGHLKGGMAGEAVVGVRRPASGWHGGPSRGEPVWAGALGIPRLAVPMTFAGRVVGVIELRGEEVVNLELDDLELVETLASNGASAIEAARAHEVTESLSVTDPLTRLPNRRQLEHDLATECDRARRYHRSSALIMLDVDGFKGFNDRYGHQAGDQVLAQFGELLSESVRASDSAYRYGGEEFAVLVREASVAAAVELAERLRQAVAERFSVLPSDAPVTASFGVVGVEQVEPEPEALIRAADQALYAAKARGRNCVVAFS